MPRDFRLQTAYTNETSAWFTVLTVTGESGWSSSESRVYAVDYDIPGPPDGYTIEPDETEVAEGDTVTLTVTGPDGTYPWIITGDLDALDVAGGELSGEVEIVSGTGTIEITLLRDGTLEGDEEFAVELRIDEEDEDPVATSATITVADTSTEKIYDVAVSTQVTHEGTEVVYTFATDGVVDGSGLWWKFKTIPEGVTVIITHSPEVVIDSGTVTAATGTSLSDSSKDWPLDAHVGESVRITAGTGEGQIRVLTSNIADQLLTSVTWDIEPDETSEYEIFTPADETVYTSDQRIDSYDIVESEPSFLADPPIIITGNTGTLTLTLVEDFSTEGPEYIVLDFYDEPGAPFGDGEVVATADPVIVVDTSNSIGVDFTVIPSATSFNEGGSINVAVTSSVRPPYPHLLYATLDGTVNSADFDGHGLSRSVFIDEELQGNFTITAAADATTEGPETFVINLRTGHSGGPVVATSALVTLNDTSTSPPTWSISAAGAVNEGTTLNAPVATTDVANGTPLWWDIEGAVNAADFVGGVMAGSVMIADNAATIAIPIAADLLTEGSGEVDAGTVTSATTTSLTDSGKSWTPDEHDTLVMRVTAGAGMGQLRVLTGNTTDSLEWTDPLAIALDETSEYQIVKEAFWINLRTGSALGDIVDRTGLVMIADTSVNPPEYAIGGGGTQPEGGSAFAFPVVTSYVLDDLLYWTVFGGAGAADFAEGGSGSISGGGGTINLTPIRDYLVEGNETFVVQLRTGSISGPIVATSPLATILDSVYTIVPVVPAIYEGDTAQFSVGILYDVDGTYGWTTVGTMLAEDFVDGELSGTVTITGGVGVINRATVDSGPGQGPRYFYLQLRKDGIEGQVLRTSTAVVVSERAIDYPAWRASADHARVILFEMDHADGTVRFGNYPICSYPDETIPHLSFDDILLESFGIQSRMDGNFAPGRIVVGNELGTLNHWLDYKYRGFEVRQYEGEPDWPFEDFRLKARLTNGGLDSVEPGQIGWEILDGKAVYAKQLPASYLPDGNPVPIAIGSVFNAAPALKNRADHEYAVNDGAIISVTPRVNGAEVASSDNLTDGTFELSGAPIGNVAVDVVTPIDTPIGIVTWLCGIFDQTADGDTLGDLPAYGLGLWYPTPPTGDKVLKDVADSIGGWWSRNALNDTVMYQLSDPKEEADFELTADDIVPGGLTLIATEEPVKTYTLCYRRNWSVASRDSLAGILDDYPALADDLTTEWLKVTATNTLGDDYPTAPDRTVYTYLMNGTHAQAECERRAPLHATERKKWQLVGLPTADQGDIGQTVKVTYPGEGWEEGKNALVLAVDRDETTGDIVMEIWL